jgi:hypothetical protein
MRRWTKRARQVLIVLHYVTSMGWLGVGLTQLTLNLVGLSTTEPSLRHDVYVIAHVLDRWVLTPLALTAATTGILLALRSKWGLLRYWWIVAKLVSTLALLVFLPVWLGGWVLTAIVATAPASPDPAYRIVQGQLLGGSAGVLTTLTIIVVVSVVKPWGRVRRMARVG